LLQWCKHQSWCCVKFRYRRGLPGLRTAAPATTGALSAPLRVRGRRYGHKSFLSTGGARAASDLDVCHRAAAAAGLSAAGKLPAAPGARRLSTAARELPATGAIPGGLPAAAGQLSAAIVVATGLSAATAVTTGLPAAAI